VAGWLLVLGGLAVTALWIWMPEASRVLVASATGLAIFGLVLVVAVFMTAGVPRARMDSPEMRRAAIHRSLLFHILHGVMWAFGFYLAGALGHGKDIPWLIALYTASMGMVDMCIRAPWRKSL
jgi:hypothetical protein